MIAKTALLAAHEVGGTVWSLDDGRIFMDAATLWADPITWLVLAFALISLVITREITKIDLVKLLRDRIARRQVPAVVGDVPHGTINVTIRPADGDKPSMVEVVGMKPVGASVEVKPNGFTLRSKA